MPDFLVVNDQLDVYKKTWKLFGVTVFSVTKTLDKSNFRDLVKNDVLESVLEEISGQLSALNPPQPPGRP